MFTSQRRTGARSSTPATPSRRRINNSCCSNSSSAYRLSLRQGSRSRRLPSQAAVVPTFNSQILIYQDVSLSQSVKSAKSGYRYELGLQDSNFIQFGYWDNLKKGLLVGELLAYDLKRMELSYIDQCKREYE